jgi:hypothetical protein
MPLRRTRMDHAHGDAEFALLEQAVLPPLLPPSRPIWSRATSLAARWAQ